MDIEITQQPPSAQQLADFYIQANFISHPDAEKMQRVVDSGSEWFVARNKSLELVGIGRLITDYARYGFIIDVIVDKGAQGSGIGTAIMGKIIEKCHELQLDSVNLWPSKGKVSFYKKFGFVALGEDQPLMKLPQ